MKVPYVDLPAQHAPLKEKLLAAVGNVIDRGQFILGDEVAQFEQRFSQLCGVRYAIGVNSGTDALVLALKALGIGPGDEVITAPNSFVASAGSIALAGARPVFADVCEDYNIDPALVRRAITPRTKAIIPVHLTGRPADMDPLLETARSHGLHVVEDAAQAVGARHRDRTVGSIGTAGCFSLHPLKTLNACGDGGVITTDDPGLYEELISLRNHGLRTRDDCAFWGYNSRLDTLQAAMLLVKMDLLDEWTERRRANARFYQQHLGELPQVRTPMDKPHEKTVYHTFVVQADRREQLRSYLAEKGIGTSIHYPVPIHLQAAAEELGYVPGSFPVAEAQAQKVLSLPVYPELELAQLEYVVDSIHVFYGSNGT